MPRLTGREVERRDDARRELRVKHEAYEAARHALGWAIAHARSEGVHWSDIGRDLGMDWRSARLIAQKAGRRV